MKTLIFLLGMVLVFQPGVNAQHCPFDGSSMIVIHVTDKEGKSTAIKGSVITLHEIDNPRADSCTYAKGILHIPFEKAEVALLKKYNNSWSSWSLERSKGCAFLDPGYYVTVLNMSQADCMIKDQGGFKYSKRRFEIRWVEKDEIIAVPVPVDRIYSLCTDAGSWKRIEAINITWPR
jgi:hypothetical protein